ncbi:MAG: hypothetical protein ACREO9_00690 [Lysobacterales bacterium]
MLCGAAQNLDQIVAFRLLQGLMALDGMVTRQAATLAFLQDFRLMMLVTLLSLPLIFLLRRRIRKPSVDALAAALD